MLRTKVAILGFPPLRTISDLAKKELTMTIAGAGKQIRDVVQTWEGVTAQPHRFGGTEYLLGTREIGHIHGDHMVDIPFPAKVRTELVTSGAAEPHHLLQNSGWVSFYIRQPEDVARAIMLLQRSYDLAVTQRNKRLHPNR